MQTWMTLGLLGVILIVAGFCFFLWQQNRQKSIQILAMRGHIEELQSSARVLKDSATISVGIVITVYNLDMQRSIPKFLIVFETVNSRFLRFVNKIAIRITAPEAQQFVGLLAESQKRVYEAEAIQDAYYDMLFGFCESHNKLYGRGQKCPRCENPSAKTSQLVDPRIWVPILNPRGRR